MTPSPEGADETLALEELSEAVLELLLERLLLELLSALELDGLTEPSQTLTTPPVPDWLSHVLMPMQVLLFSHPQPLF